MAVRRVRRIVRRIDPWTVLKVAVVFNAIAGLMFVLGTWVVWSLSLQRGIPDRIVEIFDRITLTLTVDGELYFRVIVLLALVGAILMTGLMTLGAVLYNLIADLVGGVELTVLEETYNPNPSGTRTVLRPVARPQAAATTPIDESGTPTPPLEASPEDEPPAEIEPTSDPPGVAERVPTPVAQKDASSNGSRSDNGGSAPDKDAGAGEKADEADPVHTA